MAGRIQFKTDTAKLKFWLKKRKTSLEKARQPHEETWKDIRLQFEPNLGKALIPGDPNQRSSQREDEAILNSTPRIVLSRMASGLQSGITNQSRQWFKLQTTDTKLAEQSAIRTWLDETTQTISSMANRSNVYPALDQNYKALGAFGTGAGVNLSLEKVFASVAGQASHAHPFLSFALCRSHAGPAPI